MQGLLTRGASGTALKIIDEIVLRTAGGDAQAASTTAPPADKVFESPLPCALCAWTSAELCSSCLGA